MPRATRQCWVCSSISRLYTPGQNTHGVGKSEPCRVRIGQLAGRRRPFEGDVEGVNEIGVDSDSRSYWCSPLRACGLAGAVLCWQDETWQESRCFSGARMIELYDDGRVRGIDGPFGWAAAGGGRRHKTAPRRRMLPIKRRRDPAGPGAKHYISGDISRSLQRADVQLLNWLSQQVRFQDIFSKTLPM